MQLDRSCEEVEEYISYPEPIELVMSKEKKRYENYIVVVIVASTERIDIESFVESEQKERSPYNRIFSYIESIESDEYDSEKYNIENTLIIAIGESLEYENRLIELAVCDMWRTGHI